MRKQFGGHDEKAGVMPLEVEMPADAEAVAERGAEIVARRRAAEAIAERGRFTLRGVAAAGRRGRCSPRCAGSCRGRR